MAAVYKQMAKKNSRQSKAEEMGPEDVEMEELLAEADDTTDSEEEEDDEQEEQTASSAQKQLATGMLPKTRVLMLTSRGVTSRYVFFFFFFSFSCLSRN